MFKRLVDDAALKVRQNLLTAKVKRARFDSMGKPIMGMNTLAMNRHHAAATAAT